MDEKKPLIYRLKTDIKPSGYSIPKMFVDEIKAFAALPKSMQDELSRPSPKWVADAMLTDLNNPYPRGIEEIMAGVSAVDYQVSRYNEFLAHYQHVVEAETILGIDHSRPETVLPYNHLPVSYVLQEAQQLKAVQDLAEKLTWHSASTLIFRFLDDLPESEQDEIYRLPEARRGKKQKNNDIEVAHYTVTPPSPENDGWDDVFDWFYRVPRWVCDGLTRLSEMIGYTYGTVKNRHVDYKLQYGERPMPQNDMRFD